MAKTAKREKVFDLPISSLHGSLGVIYAFEELARHGPESAALDTWTLRLAYRAFAAELSRHWGSAADYCAEIEKSDGEYQKTAFAAVISLNGAVDALDTLLKHTIRDDADQTTEQKRADGALMLVMLRSALIGFNDAMRAMGSIDTYDFDIQIVRFS